jgi:selenocysteine lyase/cysteine desulfurase
MMAVHAYKWLCSPPGIGFAYIPRRTRQWLSPALYSWRSHREWRRVEKLHHGPPELPDTAERYEGGILNFPGIFALGAVLEMMSEIGVDQIEARVLGLAESARQILRRCGASLLADRYPYYDSPLVAGRFDDGDVSVLAARLREARLAVAARHGSLRISPHFFNNEDDLDRLEQALAGGAS